MYAAISRRKLAGLAFTPPVIASAGSRSALAQTPVNAPADGGARIGASREVFDAEFGEPREESGFTIYDFRSEAQAAYWVTFDPDGNAEQIQADFEALEFGGLEYTEDNGGVSRFLPDDAEVHFNRRFLTGAPVSSPEFHIAQYSSPSLASDTGRSGNVLVADALFGRDPYGPGPYDMIDHTDIAMETFEVNAITPTGQKPGVMDDTDAWHAEYGDSVATATLTRLINPPLPGTWLFGPAIDVTPDTPFTPGEAATWIGDMLPADVELQTTYWLAPTPPDPLGHRIHVWQLPAGESIITLQYVEGGEESGVVTRLVMNTTTLDE